jgi:tRNA threonylcarbamoyladenosine biosynthesis protein TsaB
MKLLAVETATEACSAALFVNGKISERYSLTPKAHTRLILPMIDELMREAQLKPAELDALAFGCGPGSFTGVRIATGIIQGIGFAHNIPIVPVSNLATVAQDFFDHNKEDTAFVAMDARMAEIYWAVYQRNSSGFARLLGNEAVIAANIVDSPADLSGVGIGTGWQNYHPELTKQLEGRVIRYEPDHLPCARAVAKLGIEAFQAGVAVRAESAIPVYLRNNVAKKTSER